MIEFGVVIPVLFLVVLGLVLLGFLFTCFGLMFMDTSTVWCITGIFLGRVFWVVAACLAVYLMFT